jgi:putative phage-type endonuclease
MSDLQRTTEWHSQRLGLVTASSIYKVMMASTTGGYRNYMAQLVCERLTGQPTETYKSAEMQHGIDTEPEARAAYSARTGLLVEEVGFIRHPKLEAGASPDGLVGEDGLIEIKCVQPATMLDLIDSRQVPKEHRLQMQWQMAVTGRDWCDYVVYQPKLPEQLKLLIIRVPRDQPTILDLTTAVENFTRELLERTEKLKEVRL